MIESVEMEAVSKDMLGLESEEGILNLLTCKGALWMKAVVLGIAVPRELREAFSFGGYWMMSLYWEDERSRKAGSTAVTIYSNTRPARGVKALPD